MPKAGKQPSRLSTRSFTVPFTPVRNLFFRRKPEPFGSLETIVDKPHVHRTPSGSIALQNEDTAEDAIVITALDAIPFCCHEDLLTMSHSQLVSVAAKLNDKLPNVLTISLDEDASFIRNSIEVIVGLRRAVPPPAPKISRTRDVTQDVDSPSSSPCARLSTRGTPKLAILDEEDEDDLPPRKRYRRISMPSPTPRQRPRTVTQPHLEHNDMQVDASIVTKSRLKTRLARHSAPVPMENYKRDVYGMLEVA